MRRKQLQSLAIVVVNYASHGLLAQNLAAVADENPAAMIVVVDSFSSTSERHAVKDLARLHGWTLVETTVNVGFGAGMNAGVQASMDAGATSFLLLNPDAVISRESIDTLAEQLERDGFTVLSPLIYDADGKPWFAGADVRLDNGRTQSSSYTMQDAAAGFSTEAWPWLSGACLMLSKEMWLLSGGFDERYFLYWEDVDFSCRVRNAGGRLRLVEEATSVHEEGGTQKPDAQHAASTSVGGENRRLQQHRGKSEQYYYYNTRNRLLFAALNLPAATSRRWDRTSISAAWEILLRGGRRQFLYTRVPIRAAIKGTWDGLRLARSVRKDLKSQVDELSRHER